MPVPLLFLVELKKKSYWLPVPERKIRLRSSTYSLLFSLRSERKTILLLVLVRASIFFNCLGQQVETLRELQFWMVKERFVRIEDRVTAAAAAALCGT